MTNPAVARAPAARIARTKSCPGRRLDPGCALGCAIGNVTGEPHRVVLLGLWIETIEGGRARAFCSLERLGAVNPGADRVFSGVKTNRKECLTPRHGRPPTRAAPAWSRR